MSNSQEERAAQDKGPAVITAIATVTAISALFVGARIFVRTRLIRGLHLDDYLIVLSLVRTLDPDYFTLAHRSTRYAAASMLPSRALPPQRAAADISTQ